MWPVLQSFAKPGSWRYPSAEELRAETYLSLAAGAKGVFYFLYQTMPNHPERLEGLIDPDGKPTPMYAPTSALARELARLSPLLLPVRRLRFVEARAPDRCAGCARRSSTARCAWGALWMVKAARFGSWPARAPTGRSPPAAGGPVRIGTAADGEWRDALTGEVLAAREGTLTVTLAAGGGRALVRQ